MNPFEVARSIGNQGARGSREAQEETAISQILSQSMGQGVNPDAIGQLLSKVSSQKQQVVMQALAQQKQQAQTNTQNQALGNYGIDTSLPEWAQKEQLQAKTRAPAGGTTSQPVPADVQLNISEVLKNGEGKSAEEIAIDFGNAGIPPIFASPYVESRRRKDDMTDKQKIEFHKESKGYYDGVRKNSTNAVKQIQALDDIDRSIDKDDFSPLSVASFFKGLGTFGEKISEAFTTGDQAAINASMPLLLEGWKEVFGVRLTDADLKILQDKLPSIGKSKEGNQMITKIMRKYANQSVLKGQVARDVAKENKGIRPIGFETMVDDRFESMIKPIRIARPDNGNIVEVPSYLLGDALKAGGVLVDE